MGTCKSSCTHHWRHTSRTAQGIDWQAELADHGDEDATNDIFRAFEVQGRAIHPKADYAKEAELAAPLNADAFQPPSESFLQLRAMLVENYWWLHTTGHVSHPRGRRFTRATAV